MPRALIILYTLTFCLASLALAYNTLVTHYYMMNYFPPKVTYIGLILIISYLGVIIHFGKDRLPTNYMQALLTLFSVFILLALATNAVQLTPFHPIDHYLLTLDNYLNINTIGILTWCAHHPLFKSILMLSYNSLPLQMCYVPLFVIVMRNFKLINEYYLLIIISMLLGFSCYYFFPTTAPASLLTSNLFYAEQIATGIKFNLIHQGQAATNLNGGLIAFPSFHVIWAWFCVYLLRPWPIGYYILLPINILLIMACVLLGWHYFIDLLGSLIIIIISHFCCNKLLGT